jgi:hypothetical protein
MFSASQFDGAVNTFIELDVNPAKVVALYPETIAGRLSVLGMKWIPLFGGPAKADDTELTLSEEATKDASQEKLEKVVAELPVSSTGTLRESSGRAWD